MACTVIGRIQPVYRGKWDAEQEYTTLEVVTSADGPSIYTAMQQVPRGTPLSDEKHWSRVLTLAHREKANAIMEAAQGNPVWIYPDEGSLIRAIAEFAARTKGEGVKSLTNPHVIVGKDSLHICNHTHPMNLLSVDDSLTGWVNDAGQLVVEAGYMASDYIPVTGGEALTLQHWSRRAVELWSSAAFFDADKVYIRGSYDSRKSNASGFVKWKYTAPANAAYVRMSYLWEDGGWIKLERGEASTPWVPGVGDSTDGMDTGSFTACRFGDVLYGARVDFAAGKWYQTWGYQEVTDFSVLCERDGKWYLGGKAFNDMLRADDYSGRIVCNVLPTYAHMNFLETSLRVGGISGYANGADYPGENWIYLNDGVSTTLNELRENLNGRTLCIAYQLANPIEHSFNPAALSAFEGRNNVTTSGQTMTLSYNKSLEQLLKELKAQLA